MQVKQTNTQNLILATIAYYDLFNFPLTAAEIERYLVASLYSPTSAEISRVLERLIAADRLVLDRGFYALTKREQIIPVRLRKFRLAQHKIRLAQRAARWLSLLPFIRGVFASGSLALLNTEQDSDLDFFVITAVGRIWTARFLATCLLSLLGIRRKAGQQVAPDKVCLNHYVSEQGLMIMNRNIFTARIYVHLLPLYVDRPGLLKQFTDANQWILTFINSWRMDQQYLLPANRVAKTIKHCWEWLGDSVLGASFERLIRHLQKTRIERNPKTHAPNGRIVYTDQVLQFHPDSIEQHILEQYQQLV